VDAESNALSAVICLDDTVRAFFGAQLLAYRAIVFSLLVNASAAAAAGHALALLVVMHAETLARALAAGVCEHAVVAEVVRAAWLGSFIEDVLVNTRKYNQSALYLALRLRQVVLHQIHCSTSNEDNLKYQIIFTGHIPLPPHSLHKRLCLQR